MATRIGPVWRRADVLARGENAHSGGTGDEDFDALTDLFLGETRRSGAGSRSNSDDDARVGADRSSPPSPTATGPVLRLIRDDDEVSQPQPIAEITTESVEESEGEAIWAGLPVPPPARTPVVECVVLGNLPMLAAAWANQHAREVSKATDKPVALLRLQGGYASVELFGTESATNAADAEPLTLEDAIDIACEATDRWMIRGEPGGEAAVLSHTLLRVMTVLTGTDQMAREACRVTLQRLAPAISAIDASTGPMVRIGIMGGSDDSASATTAIAGVVRETLGQDAPTFTSAGRIHSGRAARSLYSGPTDRTIVDLLDLLERTLLPNSMLRTPSTNTGAPTSVALVAADREPMIEPSVETIVELDRPIVEDAPELVEVEIPLPDPTPSIAEAIAGTQPLIVTAIDEPVAQPENAAESRLEIPEPAIPATTVAVAMAIAEPEPIAQPDPRSVAERVEAPASSKLADHLHGLVPLEARCPYALSVELATDGQGQLHLLASAKGSSSDDAALAELMIASSWAGLHAGLLAVGTGRPLHADRPSLHIFTDQPKRSRRLLDTSVRVHLLTQVRVGERTAWCCVELN
ncbi:MAG: hypothetical protein K2W85_14145 [Phycisphaerales bacterium]|nr:hypothetical protein [Phycisphaerales bacterium]